MLRKAAGIDAPPHDLDIVRVLTAHIAVKDVLDHLGHQMRAEGHAIGLANA